MTAIYLPLQDNRTYLNINNPWKICDRIEDTYVVRSHHFGIVDHAMSLTLNPSPILLCPTLFLSSLDFVIHLIKTMFFCFCFFFLLQNNFVAWKPNGLFDYSFYKSKRYSTGKVDLGLKTNFHSLSLRKSWRWTVARYMLTICKSCIHD